MTIQTTKAQISLLARGSNFIIVPTYSPKGEYMAAMEKVWLNVPLKAAELRKATTHFLRYDLLPKPNISKQEKRLQHLKELRPRPVQGHLHRDKGMATVVLFKQDYINKAHNKAHDSLPQRDTMDLSQKTLQVNIKTNSSPYS